MNCKILVSYHRPSTLIRSEIFEPIHVGRAIAAEASKDGIADKNAVGWLNANMRGDDTGENISSENRFLNEMTGIYWAWKNQKVLGNPEYIGHVHYRRLFDFENRFFPEWQKDWTHGNKAIFPNLHIDSMIQPSDDTIERLLTNFSNLLPMEHNTGFLIEKGCHMEEMRPFVRDFLNRLQKKNPSVEIKEILLSPMRFYWNIFIFKKDVFNHFCEFIFPCLLEFCHDFKNTNTKNNVHFQRTPGFCAELGFNIFCKLLITKNHDVGKCGVVQFNQIATPQNTLRISFPYKSIFRSFLSCNKKTRLKHKHRILNALTLLKYNLRSDRP